MSSKQYQPISSERGESEEALLGDEKLELRVRKTWSTSTLIIVAETMIIAVLLVYTVWQSMGSSSDFEPRSFSTDFGDLGKHILYKRQKFVNPIHPSKDLSKLEIWWDEDEKRYGGEPGAEIDESWDELMSVTTFNISGQAAKPAIGNTYQFDDGNYVFGLSVYHALHCVNAVRMMLYPDNYIFNEPPEETALHKIHCVEYLRQYVQCNADLTPFWGDWLGKYRLVLRPYQEHTCRDFSSLHQWVLDNKSN